MLLKKIHYFSGSIIFLFIILHLSNHLCSLISLEDHIAVMNKLRIIYRNFFVESLLFISLFIQLVTGFILIRKKSVSTTFDKIHVWSGIYLAIFTIIHISAVLVGRFILKLDTNIYFGIAGINSFPLNLFFIPYYGFAIVSFFSHLAAIHNKKMKYNISFLTPKLQAWFILITGIVLTMFLFYGLTNHFRGIIIPKEYRILVGEK